MDENTMKIRVGSRRSFRGTVIETYETGGAVVKFDGKSLSNSIVTARELAASRPLVKRKRVVIKGVEWREADVWVAVPTCSSNNFNCKQWAELVGTRCTLIIIPEGDEK